MYKLNLALILVITILLVLLYLNNSEHFGGSVANLTNEEALRNISSLYNSGNLTASNVNATDNLNAKKINVNNGLVEMGGDQDRLLIRPKTDNNDNSFWFFNKQGYFGRYLATTQKDAWNISDTGSANFTTEVKTGKLIASGDVEIGGKTFITTKTKNNSLVSYDIREYLLPGFIQDKKNCTNLIRGFMVGWADINGRKLWSKLKQLYPNTPIVFAGDLRNQYYHFIRVNPGFKVRLWHYSRDTANNTFVYNNDSAQYTGLTNGAQSLSLIGPQIFSGTRCTYDKCEPSKNAPCCSNDSETYLAGIHLIWCGFSEENWPEYPTESYLIEQVVNQPWSDDANYL